MRVLLTHRYFWPDSAPYGTMLRAIGDHLAEAGHEVQVVTSRPSYRRGLDAPRREILGQLSVRRLWMLPEYGRNPLLRALNALIYCIGLYLHIRLTKPDLVTASSFPPVFAAAVASWAAHKTGARFLYHIQDLHPEVSQISGGWLGRDWAAKLLRWIDHGTLNRADQVVVLSEDMAKTLRRRPGGQNWPIRVLNNFDLGALGTTAPPAGLKKASAMRRLIFAGNLGRFQNLDVLAEGVALLFPRFPQLELMFLGDGVAAAGLKQRWHAHPQIRFAPFLPYDQASQIIAGADLGLVSLSPGLCHVAYPSKVLSYAALGLPMLALVERDSCLARDLIDSGIGIVPEALTARSIADALAQLLDAPDPLTALRTKVRTHHQAVLSRAKVLPKWPALLAEVCQ